MKTEYKIPKEFPDMLYRRNHDGTNSFYWLGSWSISRYNHWPKIWPTVSEKDAKKLFPCAFHSKSSGTLPATTPTQASSYHTRNTGGGG